MTCGSEQPLLGVDSLSFVWDLSIHRDTIRVQLEIDHKRS
jgi:hypothetical protein